LLLFEPIIFPFAALLLLIIPFPWLCAALLAAVWHETAHIAIIFILGGRVQKIVISVRGTKICAYIPSVQRELLCAIAGPAGSFLLVFLCHTFPRLALCGIIQGLFNLIPIYPLDGGRILYCLFSIFLPEKAAFLCQIIGDYSNYFFLFLSIYGAIFLSTGPIPPAIFLLFLFRRKKTCKQAGIGIQ